MRRRKEEEQEEKVAEKSWADHECEQRPHSDRRRGTRNIECMETVECSLVDYVVCRRLVYLGRSRSEEIQTWPDARTARKFVSFMFARGMPFMIWLGRTGA